MNHEVSAVLKARLSAKRIGQKYSRLASGKTTYFTTYPCLVNVLLKKYAANRVIAETESNITRFAQSANMSPSQML